MQSRLARAEGPDMSKLVALLVYLAIGAALAAQIPTPQAAAAQIRTPAGPSIAAQTGVCRSDWIATGPASRPAGPRPAGLPSTFCVGQPGKPAILLFHGLHQSEQSWTKPSSTQYNFDHQHTPPDRDLGKHAAPNAGVYKVGESDRLDIDSLAWLPYLLRQGFTVATFTQPCCSFDAAYPAALAAFQQFLELTRRLSPAAPPPVALIGHSRGGLIIRRLLKEQGNASGRIRWVVTLHSPHHGSAMAQVPQALAEQTAELFNNVQLPPAVHDDLKKLALFLVQPLNQFIDDGSRELAPDSALIRGLAAGEQPLPGIRYYTFGGTSPTLYRLYVWTFTPMSAVPQYKNLEQYFDWQAKAAEVAPVSPILDKVRPIVAEIKAGSGDSLVTDASAHLPFATHFTDRLNHAEVLWDRSVQEAVVQILAGSAPTAVTKPVAGLAAGAAARR